MLPYKNRLIKRKDFEKVYKGGRFFSSGIISLKVRENELADSRIGFSIGVKFSPRAVVRNRVKRQLREIFRINLSEIKRGLDIVVMVGKSEKKIEGATIKNMLREVLNKGKLIN